MQFDRDELALLSRRGRVPRASRARPRPADPGRCPVQPRPRERRESRLVKAVRRWVARARSLRAGVRATWTVFGDGQQDR